MRARPLPHHRANPSGRSGGEVPVSLPRWRLVTGPPDHSCTPFENRSPTGSGHRGKRARSICRPEPSGPRAGIATSMPVEFWTSRLGCEIHRLERPGRALVCGASPGGGTVSHAFLSGRPVHRLCGGRAKPDPGKPCWRSCRPKVPPGARPDEAGLHNDRGRQPELFAG